MATDLKTLTPGTAAASSVVVGATSAAAASPSLFTTTGSGNVVLSASPTLTGNTVVSSGSFGLSGNISSAAWTTSGIRYANVAATLLDTSSTGTVATAYTDVFGGNTIAASNATTFTNYYTAWVGAPTAGTNVTFTGKWALGLGGSLQINGGTVTTNTTPALDISQTWNAGAVTFTGLKFNATDTASASGSLLLDIGVGGGSYSSVLNVTKTGRATARSTLANVPWFQVLGTDTASSATLRVGAQGGVGAGVVLIDAGTSGVRWDIANGSTNAGYLTIQDANGQTYLQVHSSGAAVAPTLGFGTTGSAQRITVDTYLSRAAAATLQLGAADAAAPVAQTLQVQSVVAGTTNTAGANFTIAGSKGTGNAAGGSIVFQVAPAGSSGTAQNALATALAINSAGLLQFAGTTSSFPALKRVFANLQVIAADGTSSAGFIVGNQALATTATDGFLYIPTCAGTPTGTPTTQTGTAPLVVDSTNNKLYVYVGGAWTAMN